MEREPTGSSFVGAPNDESATCFSPLPGQQPNHPTGAGELATPKGQRGATLIEALVAIVILAIGMLGQAAFMLTAMRDSQQSRYRVIASYYAEEMISMAIADTGNRAKYAVSASACTESSWAPCTNWLTNLQRDLPQVSNATTPITVSIDNTSTSANFGKIVVAVQWAAPDSSAQKYVATSNLNLIQ